MIEKPLKDVDEALSMANDTTQSQSLLVLGYQDLRDGAQAWRIWHLIGAGELRRRYSRSRIGQFWLTISTAISILIMALVWSILFKLPIREMLPYMAVSIILWQFFSGIVSEATSLLTSNNHLLLSQKMNCSVVVYAIVYRHLLILAHNAIIIPVVFFLSGTQISVQIFLVVPAIVLVTISSVWVTYLIGMLCARFRDISNIINSAMQLAFYVTPVIWKPGFMPGEYQWIVDINPFAYFLSILRDPFLSGSFHLHTWVTSIAITFFGMFVSLIMIGKYRRKLMFWI